MAARVHSLQIHDDTIIYMIHVIYFLIDLTIQNITRQSEICLKKSSHAKESQL